MIDENRMRKFLFWLIPVSLVLYITYCILDWVFPGALFSGFKQAEIAIFILTISAINATLVDPVLTYYLNNTPMAVLNRYQCTSFPEYCRWELNIHNKSNKPVIIMNVQFDNAYHFGCDRLVSRHVNCFQYFYGKKLQKTPEANNQVVNPKQNIPIIEFHLHRFVYPDVRIFNYRTKGYIKVFVELKFARF